MNEIEKDEEHLKEEIVAITKNIERLKFPVNAIDKRHYFALWVNKGKDIVCQGKHPIIFHKDVYAYCLATAKEMQATVQRFDKSWDKAISGSLTFIEVYIIRIRKQRKLTRMEIANNELLKAKKKFQNQRGVPEKQSKPTINIADDLDMPPVSGTEHPSDGEQQDTKVYELPSNDTVAGNKTIN